MRGSLLAYPEPVLIGLIGGIGLILLGGVVWGVTAFGADGRLPRNGWAGIRTGATGASDAAWRAGHQAALPISRTTGVAALLIGLAMIVDGLIVRNTEGSVLFWVLFAAGYGGVLITSVIAAVRASCAARATSP